MLRASPNASGPKAVEVFHPKASSNSGNAAPTASRFSPRRCRITFDRAGSDWHAATRSSTIPSNTPNGFCPTCSKPFPRKTRIPARTPCKATSAKSRVLPPPDSASTQTNWALPVTTCRICSSICASSCSRPTKAGSVNDIRRSCNPTTQAGSRVPAAKDSAIDVKSDKTASAV